MAARKIPPSGKGRKDSEAKILNRRKQIAFYYLTGKPQAEIAAIFGVDHSQVSRELTIIRKQWKEEYLTAIEERKSLECAKLDNLEAVAWEAWERSCKDAETRKKSVDEEPRVTVVTDKGKKSTQEKMTPIRTHLEVVTREQAGDPRFLDRVAWCIEMRMKVFGMLKEDKRAVNIMNINWDGLIGDRENMQITDADDPIERRILMLEVEASDKATNPL